MLSHAEVETVRLTEENVLRLFKRIGRINPGGFIARDVTATARRLCFKGGESYVRQAITVLVASGRLKPVVVNIWGRTVHGFVVVEALKSRESVVDAVASSDLNLTSTDREFLRNCSVAA